MLEIQRHRSQIKKQALTLLNLIHQLTWRWAYSLIVISFWLWLLQLTGRKRFKTLSEPGFILFRVKINARILEFHHVGFCLLMIKNWLFMLGFASSLSQVVCESFVRRCLIKLNSTHLMHLLELLETVCSDRLCSIVMNKWWVVAVLVRNLSLVGLADLFSILFRSGLARFQSSTRFQRHHLDLVECILLTGIWTHGSLIAEGITWNFIAACSHRKLTNWFIQIVF